ncbi:MAG TPA: serine protease [Solirubrobacteraceae bacterium]
MTRLTGPARIAVVSVLALGLVAAAPVALAVKHARFEHARSKAHAAIIGGAPAELGAFPSLAFIVNFQGKQIYQCTGTVVAPSLVLTAGHCVESLATGTVYKSSGFRVETGAVDWSTAEGHESTVLGVIPYPGFVRSLDVGDAALLVLSAPVTAPAVTLAAQGRSSLLEAGTTATVAGWGKTSFNQRTFTKALNFAPTVVQANSWCERNAPPFFSKGELCAITPPKYSTGACSGDSGGPLLAPGPTEGETVEVGVTVHGYGPCSTRRPTVYTRVDAIAGWVSTWVDAYNQPTGPRPH